MKMLSTAFNNFKFLNFLLPFLLIIFSSQTLLGCTPQNNATAISTDISKTPPSQNIEYQIDSSAIITAIENSDFESLDLIFENKKDLDQNNFQNGNILHLAISLDNFEVLKYLIQEYFDDIYPLIDAKNQSSLTPLMLAANIGSSKSIAFLISKGANIEEKDSLGKTAIFCAALNNQIISIEILSYLGADINAIDANNLRAVDYLRDKKDVDSQNTIELLNELSRQNETLKTALPLYTYFPIENLVFEGGGAKGVAFVGAIKELENLNALTQLKRVAGTSAGAISASLLVVGYTADEVKSILFDTDLTTFLDYYISEEKIKNLFEEASITKIFTNIKDEFVEIFKSPLTQIENSLNYFKSIFDTDSLCAGEDFRKWIEKKIFDKTNIEYLTFKELKHLREKDDKFKHLHIFTTKVHPSLEIFRISSEDERFDDVIVSDAIRASMSIPGVFQPHHLYIKDSSNNRVIKEDFGLFIDGGVLDNYPITAFDTLKYQSSSYTDDDKDYVSLNKRTLGLSLYSPDSQQEKPNEVTNMFDLGIALTELYFNSENLYHELEPYDDYRTIKIDDIDVSTLDFQLSDEVKKELEESGEEATKKFFAEQQNRLESLNLIIDPNAMRAIETSL